MFIEALSQHLLPVIFHSPHLQILLQVNICATCLSLYSHLYSLCTPVFPPGMKGPVAEAGDLESLKKCCSHPLLLAIFFAA